MRKLYLLVLAFLLPAISQAQITWDFSTATPLSGIPAGVAVSAVSQGNNNGTTTLLTTTSASSGYTGATGGNNAGAAASVGSFRPDTTTYFEWTLTPIAGVAITVNQINFGSRSTSTGPQAYAIRTNLDSFATAVASSTLANNSTWALVSNATSIVGAAGQAITIRIYAYNGAGNASKNTANWRIDDLSVLVATSGNVPAPTLTVSPTTLTFATAAGNASAIQNVTVGGTNLTSDITVTVSPGYEISRNSIFSSSLTLPQHNGTVADTPIMVRLAASTPAGPINGFLSLHAAGADSQTVTLSGSVTAPAAKVVVNQVYGGGGNSGSVFSNDFIELFNDDDTTVNLAGWSVQYASATGTSWQVTPLTGTIPPHGYFLVAESAGATPSTPLPTPDVMGGIAMSAASGKVLLSNSSAAQTGANPSGATVMDLIGYGPTATGFEGSPAPVLTNSTADLRTPDGQDANNNSIDFVAGRPIPRNSTYTTAPPVVQTFVPVNNATNIPSSITPVLVLSKPVVKGSGSIILTTNVMDSIFIPVSDARIVVSNDSVIFQVPLSGGNTYSIRISPEAFVDAFGNGFAGLTTNSAWTFTTYNNTIAQTLPFVTSFDSCLGNGLLPNGFTEFSVTGAQVWDCTAFGRDSSAPAGTAPFGHAVQINGFASGANHTNQDWLITPRFNLNGTTFPLLSYWSRNAFAGAPLMLKISTDYPGSGDPTVAHWTDLNGKFPSQASDVWTQSVNINLSAFKDSSVYIAFVYTSTTQDGSRWTIDDVSLINSPTPPPPTLTLSTNNLEFGYAAAGTSAVRKLIVTGNDLVSGIKIMSAGNFSVSADSVHFSDSILLSAAMANNMQVPVFVRFKPSVANSQFIDSVLVTISDSTAIVNVKGNSIDPASTLNVIDWNLNWFGTPDPTLGPTDKALQKKNVGTVLSSLHADLYALEEVCDEQALDSIVATMPGYAVVVGQYGSYSNPTIPGGPDALNTVQKLAFVYNTTKVSVIRTDSLLTLGVTNPLDPSTRYYNDWASGRFPYMLTANVTLSDNRGGTNTRTMRFINVHAKANTAPVLTAYDRRANGASALDSLLKAQYPADNVMILGDFNDDLNTTITAGVNPPITSWSAFTITDSALYTFPTQPLSPEGQHSDVNFTSVIDNVILNDSMSKFYLPASATVRSDVATLVTNYGTTTTDHYPVFTQYSFTPPGSQPAQPPLVFTAVKQGAKALLQWTTTPENGTKWFEVQKSINGRLFLPIGLVPAKKSTGVTTDYSFVDPLPLPGTNYYRLKEFDSAGKSTLSDTVSLTFTPPLKVIILPNPAIGSTNLIVSNADGQYLIQIIDGNGSVVRQLNGLPSTPVMPVSLHGLRGIYTVKVTTANDVATAKLLVL